jgi:hypothetical protein
MAESQPDTGDTDTPTPTDNPDQPTSDTGIDLAAEVEKWKAQARKHEDRAKANAAAATELEKVRAESMTEMERAIAAARDEAASETRKTYGSRLVDAEVKAAVKGTSLDVDALLDGLDRTRFLNEDGEPDTDSITAWVERLAPKGTDDQQTLTVDLGQGQRGTVPALNSSQLQKDLERALGVG